ncbi:hypothetical protein CK220_21165 [Mesorhizobium sp. WSM3860]|nr:hypothetical protein CK220_21165 [Mesorhizobium sp. WSM3860]
MRQTCCRKFSNRSAKGPEGTGLGLAQVYGFAQQSGGAVESDVGKGTSVTLCLPRADMACALQRAETERPTAANVVQLRTKGRLADSGGSGEG